MYNVRFIRLSIETKLEGGRQSYNLPLASTYYILLYDLSKFDYELHIKYTIINKYIIKYEHQTIQIFRPQRLK